jgi:hypothetical protein
MQQLTRGDKILVRVDDETEYINCIFESYQSNYETVNYMSNDKQIIKLDFTIEYKIFVFIFVF